MASPGSSPIGANHSSYYRATVHYFSSFFDFSSSIRTVEQSREALCIVVHKTEAAITRFANTALITNHEITRPL